MPPEVVIPGEREGGKEGRRERDEAGRRKSEDLESGTGNSSLAESREPLWRG